MLLRNPEKAVNLGMQIAFKSFERVNVARRFYKNEGCASRATRQILENYFRVIMGKKTLQTEAEETRGNETR
jgi:hypothetical protein